MRLAGDQGQHIAGFDHHLPAAKAILSMAEPIRSAILFREAVVKPELNPQRDRFFTRSRARRLSCCRASRSRRLTRAALGIICATASLVMIGIEVLAR
jgi:hypothetical protein